MRLGLSFVVFFFNDTATTEIYTLSLHDALPIWRQRDGSASQHDELRIQCQLKNTDRRHRHFRRKQYRHLHVEHDARRSRSEEHTSELQSHMNLLCRVLLKKQTHTPTYHLPYNPK